MNRVFVFFDYLNQSLILPRCELSSTIQNNLEETMQHARLAGVSVPAIGMVCAQAILAIKITSSRFKVGSIA